MAEATATPTPAAPTPPPEAVQPAEQPVETAPETTPEPEQPKAPEAPPKRTRKLKVNGQETEVDEESLILAGMRAEQKERAAQQKWQEVQRAQQEIQKFQSTWQQDPVAALASLGPQARQAAEQFLLRELQREQMDPRERAMLEERARREELEAKFREQEEAAKSAEAQRLQQHYTQQLDAEFAEVMKTANLPKTTESVRLLAQEAMQLAEMGIPPTKDQLLAVVPVVQDKISKMASSVMGQMDGPALLKWLGPDIRKRIREAEVAAVRSSPAKPAAVTPQTAPVEPRQPPRMLTQEEWRRKYYGDG